MTGNRISRSKLNTELKKLPLPVQEHCKRCKLIASYLVEKIRCEDWFLDLKLNEEYITAAVYLHDIGKTQIPKDNLYAEHNVTKAKQNVYRAHIGAGVDLIEAICDMRFADFDDKKFESYVYQAITEHHESADGCGFPNRLNSKKMSLTGKITAIADTIDNMFFVGAAEERDFEELTKKLAEMAGTELDSELLQIMLADKVAFSGFIGYIDARYKKKRKIDNYGLQLRFSPIRNIIENNDREYICDYVINDPFYGIVKPDVFLPVADMSSQTPRLTLLALERLCLMLDRVKERGGKAKPISVRIQPTCFEAKKFVAEALKLLDKYKIKDHVICLVVEEKGLTELDEEIDYASAFAKLREGGYRMALNCMSESSTMLASLDTLLVDYLFINPTYTHRIAINANTYGVASGLLDIAHNLHVSVVFLGSDTHAIEKALLRMRARFATGELYGAPLREHEMVSMLVADGGDA